MLTVTPTAAPPDTPTAHRRTLAFDWRIGLCLLAYLALVIRGTCHRDED